MIDVGLLTVALFGILVALPCICLGISLLLRKLRMPELLLLFVSALAVLWVFLAGQWVFYPFSNAFVLGLSAVGGTLLGRWFYRSSFEFFAILLLGAFVDILGFLASVRGPAPVGSAPVPWQFLTYFIVLFGSGYYYAIGAIDLIVLTAIIVFFRYNGASGLLTLLAAEVALLLPGILALIVPYKNEVPLLPFFAGVAFLFEGLRRLRHWFFARRIINPITSSGFSGRGGR